jgi:hypothetical protein
MRTFGKSAKEYSLIDAFEKLTGSSDAELVTFLAWNSKILSLSILKSCDFLLT